MYFTILFGIACTAFTATVVTLCGVLIYKMYISRDSRW